MEMQMKKIRVRWSETKKLLQKKNHEHALHGSDGF